MTDGMQLAISKFLLCMFISPTIMNIILKITAEHMIVEKKQVPDSEEY